VRRIYAREAHLRSSTASLQVAPPHAPAPRLRRSFTAGAPERVRLASRAAMARAGARAGAPAAKSPSVPRPRPPRRLGDGTGFGHDAAPAKTRPYVLHDQANLVCLPLLCALCCAGLAGVADCWLISVAFTAYILADLAWILIVPESLPRFPLIITVHHLITLALLSHPLRYPQDAHFTCLDGLVEMSTFFMIARRHCGGRLSAVMNALYWFTTVALRFMLQPYLLRLFYRLAQPYSALDRGIVVGSQAFLCFFNCGLVVVAVNTKLYQKKKASKTA